ncbi:DUF4179 domain-containing protein [Niallia sp. 03190]|uniref:DUF4179 domain-containing protein n=1 Tax=Niallia sp. 03190 TaxID=3458061 RepID=UPI004043E24F
MSIYKELNNVNLDVSEFEAIPLSKNEQKRVLKQAKNKLSLRKPKKKWMRAGVATAAVCVLSLSLTINKETIASVPFIGEVIEKYINSNEDLNYSSYKTAIGETAENELGKLTLNEVMLDDRQLFLSSTFEPADNVDFDYQTSITPKVKINGKDYMFTTGGQSIEINNTMFTIYNDIDLKQDIDTEDVKIEISYDNWNFDKVIEQPWTFHVEVSQAKILAEKKTFEMNKPIKLSNGETVIIQKVVTTPISTTVYYDLSQSKSEDIYFNIQSEEGKEEGHRSGFTSNDVGAVSVVRFNGLSLKDNNYYLVPFDSNGNKLSEVSIPIK